MGCSLIETPTQPHLPDYDHDGAFYRLVPICQRYVTLMDPLSLTVATITLLQTATTTVQICNDYRISLENAPKDVARLTKEVISLRRVFQILVELSERAESAATSDEGDGTVTRALSYLPTVKLLLEPDGLLDQ